MARKRTTVPTKPDDARAQRSVEALRGAFLSLIETRPLEQILLRDITDAAGLSYPTFFRRYASKEALLIDIARAEVRALMAMSRAAIAHGAGEGGAALCEHVQAHRRLWKALLTGGVTAQIREEFALAGQELGGERERVIPDLPLDLAAAVFAATMFEIFAWWLRQPEDYPVANVIKLFDALIVDTLGQPRRLGLV